MSHRPSHSRIEGDDDEEPGHLPVDPDDGQAPAGLPVDPENQGLVDPQA